MSMYEDSLHLKGYWRNMWTCDGTHV